MKRFDMEASSAGRMRKTSGIATPHQEALLR
jgi:hypothetical protein